MTAHHPPPGHLRAHREAWAVLPFFVNATLDPAERAGVEAHLGYCVTCRAEVEMLRQVERGVRDAALETTQVDRAWHRLAAGLTAPPPPAMPARARWTGFVEWLRDLLAATPGPARAALAVQAVLLAAVVGGLGLPGPSSTGPARPGSVAPGPASPGVAYQTLSAGDATPAAAALRVRFADEAPESRLRALLLEAGLRIVDGPSAAGLYALAPLTRGGSLDAAVDRLRNSTDTVRLIEVLPGAASPATLPAPILPAP